MKVEEALVRAIGRCAWPKRGGKEFDIAAVGFEGLGGVEVFKVVTTMREDFEDFEWSTFCDGQLGDSIVCSGAMDFDLGSDDVAGFERDEFPGGVDAMSCSEAAIFSEVAEDFGGESGLGVAKAEEFVDAGDAVAVGGGGWKGGQVAVDGETKGAADGRNTADDVGTVDGGCVPGVGGNMGGFRADFGITRALGSSDGDGFVEETEETFDRDGLVVAAKAWLAGKLESRAHGGEMTAKGRTGVGGNEEAKTDAEEDVFHKNGSKSGRIEDINVGGDGESSEVAHSCEDVFGAGVGLDVTRLPDIDVEDGERGGHRPGVYEFAAMTDR